MHTCRVKNQTYQHEDSDPVKTANKNRLKYLQSPQKHCPYNDQAVFE